MNPSAWLDAASVDGDPEALWDDGERKCYRVWRRSTEGTRRPYLATLPSAEHPTRASLDRLAHEYGLKNQLDGAWAVRPLELVRERGTTMLVLEYHDGEPLDRLIARPVEPGGFLRVAVALASALVRLHERGLVHKDIKPGNILVDPTGDRVWLMGFGVASRLTREHQAPEPPELIAGTLSHMAPEQTGRMNRSIDSRSDLYSLGVTLYQALTGSLPFTATDPLEWVHCHIARMPVPPSLRVADVPPQLSAIIMKLLAKTPEERYQTAAGVGRDLRRCLADWDARGVIDVFPVAEYDIPDRVLIPERLYGRERETRALLAAFDNVIASGMPSLVLVSGHAGIGKSSVVHELHKVLVPPRGLFASGKFDQLKRDIPYATLAQAFHSLIRQLLGKPEAELRRWRDTLCQALTPNAALLLDLIPELELIIGAQPAVPEVAPPAAKARFQTTLRQLIGAFARAEHPLALFLDDLQWLDGATLDLLENILIQPEPQHLLLVGAYRDNEVDAAHPLRRKLSVIRESGGVVRDIVLGPLEPRDLTQWLADALHCPAERTVSLAQLVHEKTAGNPFFANQFLRDLVERDLITFDASDARWRWDLGRIRSTGYTDNVVDLMVAKLSRLPRTTQEALKELACLGNGANPVTLATVHGVPEEQLHSELWEALRLELIVRSGDAYRFVHDRVQEAAYALIPEEQRAAGHLRIGRLLIATLAPGEREEAIFEIVGHFNRASSLVTSAGEREEVAALNLVAGERAKKAATFASALTYLVSGAAMLPENSWEHLHDLTFALELNRAECEYVTGLPGPAEERLSALATRAATLLERAAVACLRMDLYLTLDQSSRAVAVGLECLRDFGVEWSAHPSEEDVRHEYERIWSQLGSRAIEELVDLPVMDDTSSLATLNVLTKLATPAQATDSNLVALVNCRAVNLSLERGNCDASCYAYVWVGAVAGARFGDYRTGYRIGRIGCELVEKRGWTRLQPGTLLIFAAVVMPWARPVKAGRDLFHRAIDEANSIGDVVSAAGTGPLVHTNMLAAGDHLADVQRLAQRHLEIALKARFGLAIAAIETQLGLVRTLRGSTWRFGSLDHEQFDEPAAEVRFDSNPNLQHAEWSYWIRKLQARFFAGDYAAAIECSSRAQRLSWVWSSALVFDAAEYHLYSALSRAACCDSASRDERQEHLDALALHQRQLDVWAKTCPENFENRALLVGAEIARVEGRLLDAERLYEAAIQSARENEFVHNEALANELAARFYAGRGFERIAAAYIRDARDGYRQWGADGKVRQLEEHHPHLRDGNPRPDPTGMLEAPVEQLDLAVVLQALKAVSGETDLEKLIATVMRLGIELAGADRGLLILPRGDGYRIGATAGIGEDGVTVALRETAVTSADLPESIFQYVVRTRETVLLHDASADGAFSGDDYLRQHGARSVLCTPLLKQTRTVGVLYLENRLTSEVFTPARLALLKLLASEAAISIENARLDRELQEREARVRRLIDANIIGIFLWHADGRVLDANEEFLRIIGYSREDLISGRLRWTDFTLPESRERDLRVLEQLREGGRARATERELLRKEGTRVPVMTGGTMFEGGSDEGVAFVVDLTELRRAERALRERERESRLILETIPGLVATLTPNGEIDAVNHELIAFCGQPLEAMKEWGTNGTVHPDDLPHMGPIFAESIAAGTPYDFEARIRRFDGVYCWLQVRGLPLRDSDGQIVRWYVLLADVDDRKRAEDAIEMARSELSRVARVMTMSALTASIAHEVNQPLSGIITNASTCLRMLDASPPNIDGARETAKRTMRDGKRAADVITRLRAMFSKREFTLESMDLNDATREVIALSLSDLQRNRVILRQELADPLPLIMGDRIQLQQVILNLLRNASEAMAEVNDRPRQLIVRTEREGDAGVRVTVRDAGVGLDHQSLDKLFDTFYTTKQGGMGIGLSVSRSIIERHHGRMWAEPNDGPGATFAFAVPVA
jgi:PAS domain S-box-containing protein